MKFDVKNRLKSDGYKLSKLSVKNDQNRRVINRPKNCSKMTFMAGG
jgi:hypothetical protein